MDEFEAHFARFKPFAKGDRVRHLVRGDLFTVAAVVPVNGLGLLGSGIDLVSDDGGRMRVQPESIEPARTNSIG